MTPRTDHFTLPVLFMRAPSCATAVPKTMNSISCSDTTAYLAALAPPMKVVQYGTMLGLPLSSKHVMIVALVGVFANLYRVPYVNWPLLGHM